MYDVHILYISYMCFIHKLVSINMDRKRVTLWIDKDVYEAAKQERAINMSAEAEDRLIYRIHEEQKNRGDILTIFNRDIVEQRN